MDNGLVFKEEENPQAKLIACARNDKLFSDGSDLTQLAKEVRYVIGGGDEVAKAFRVIALPVTWLTDPWSLSTSPNSRTIGMIGCRSSCYLRSQTNSMSVSAIGSRIISRNGETRSGSCLPRNGLVECISRTAIC